MIQQNGFLVAFHSSNQRCAAASSTEAEYVSLAECMHKGVIPSSYFTGVLGLLGHTVIQEDNKPWILRATEHDKQNEYVDVRCHTFCKAAASEKIRLNYCPTIEMIADM